MMVGVAIELLGVSEVFGQLQDALNNGRGGGFAHAAEVIAQLALQQRVRWVMRDTERAGKPKTHK